MASSKAVEKYKETRVLSAKPWFVASILITVFLIGILTWNLFSSYYILNSLKNKELVIERASWKLLFYAEGMQMSARISATSGDLLWKKKYVQAKKNLTEVTEHIPALISSAEVSQKTDRIRAYLHNINSIEDRVFELVGRGDRDEALELLAGWKYTNNQHLFSESARDLSGFIQDRIARRTEQQQTRILIFLFLVGGSLLALLILWTITIRTWRLQNKEKEAAEEELVHSNIKLEEATEELKESEKRYRNFIENASELIWLSDREGNFVFANRAIAGFLGYETDDLIGRNYTEFVAPEHKEEVLRFYHNQLLEKIDETYFEFMVVPKNGKRVWLGSTVKMIRGDNNEIQFHTIARDINERKRAEIAREELENQKSRFFSNISHEIRTPLTLILSPVESALQGDLGRDMDSPFLEGIHRNALRLLKLINSLLDFSTLEAGQMTLKIREIDTVTMIGNYVSTVQSAAESRDLTLAFRSEIEDCLIYADLEKLDKIIMNLLSNAMKFTDEGGSVVITLEENDKSCRFSVADNGVGIPPDKISSIFNRFSQADSSSTRKFEGTGIGLALAKELTELHGGFILVESRHIDEYPENHGTTFTVVLPKGKDHLEGRDDVEFVKNVELDEQKKTEKRFIGMREMHDLTEPSGNKYEAETDETFSYDLLVVEDNPDMRDFISMLLQEHYRIHTAENGLLGLERAREIMPDLIITDVMMPEMNGYDMTKALKADEKLMRIPVLMITAKADMSYKLEGLEYGADDYLTKPFNSKELLARIKGLLKTYELDKRDLQRKQEIENDLDIARLLQHKLLPEKDPAISGFTIHSAYIPMDKVGGDFYDFREREGFLDILVADVCGHGLSGAFLAAVAKIAIHGIIERPSTRRVLNKLNDIICRFTVKYKYITTFFCSINLQEKRLVYSSAGHLPQYLYRSKTDKIHELKSKGMPLGLFRSIEIGEETIDLQPGDRLILHTDGIIESENEERGMFGEERFLEFIRENREKTPEEFNHQLLRELIDYNGSDNFNDDLTMVVVDILQAYQ